MNQFFKKSSVLAIVSLFIGSLVATSVVQAAGKIRLSSRSTNWDMVLIESGAAKKYGIEIELVRVKTGVEVSEALIGGSVDVDVLGGGGTELVFHLTEVNALLFPIAVGQHQASAQRGRAVVETLLLRNVCDPAGQRRATDEVRCQARL